MAGVKGVGKNPASTPPPMTIAPDSYSFTNFLVIVSLPVSIIMIYALAFSEAILQLNVLAVAVAL